MKASRRQFLQGTAASTAAAFTIVPRHVLGGPQNVPPSEKVNIAVIGVGGQGRTNARELFKEEDARIIAIADPAKNWDLSPFYFRGVAGSVPVSAEVNKRYADSVPDFNCAVYEDFRVMLEKEKSIDAVLIATPDHLHAYTAIFAMKNGKHVYVEKPMAHNVAEARLMAKVAKETGMATQMGNQGHSNDTIRETVELIHDGALGTIREVHAWVPSSRWNRAMLAKPKEAQTLPEGLNWDLWVGPREPIPFHTYFAPVTWRDFWEFGCGAGGDFGCHDLDSACWALDLQSPETIEVRPAGHSDADIIPHGELGYYHFAARGNRPAVKIFWYSGGIRPDSPEELGRGQVLPSRGVLFVGDKGMMLTAGSGGACRLLPAERNKEYQRPTPSIRRVKNHHRDWLDAVKGGPAAGSNFDYASRLTEIVLLGVASLRTNTKLYWDPVNLTAPGVKNADVIFKGTYRKGWELS